MLISYSNPEKNAFYLEMGLLLNPFVLLLVNKLTCIIPKHQRRTRQDYRNSFLLGYASQQLIKFDLRQRKPNPK